MCKGTEIEVCLMYLTYNKKSFLVVAEIFRGKKEGQSQRVNGTVWVEVVVTDHVGS